MIRKYLYGIVIGFIGLFGFSYCLAVDGNDLPYNFYTQDVLNIISKDLNFSNSNGGNWLDLKAGGSSDGRYNVFWVSGKLYKYGYYKYWSDYNQGFFSEACKVYSLTGDLPLPSCYSNNDRSVSILDEFYNLTGYNFTKVYVVSANDTSSPLLCFYNANNYYYYCFEGLRINDSLGIIRNETDFSQYAGVSPFSVGYVPDIGNGGIELSSDYSAINYYEKTYGWDSSICYAGVDDLTSLYGQSSVAFQEGYGLSIFQVFSGLYNGDQNLTHMYVWLNSLLGNYELWFAIGSPTLTDVGNPPYLLNYNSGSYQVDVYYDDLVFPFAGKPVALYYLASNIESQSVYNTMGASVVSYCNIKINGGSFDDIVSEADKNNITDYTKQSNINNGLNPDGSDIEHDGYFGSGVSIAFSGDTSIKNTLKNFFEEFDKGLSGLDVNTDNRILPTWLVTAFIFVVLFKFLRKR